MRKILPLLVALLLLAVADDPSPSVADLVNEWVLTSLSDGSGEVPVPDGPLRMRIEGAEINGDLGCNSFFGSVMIADDGPLVVGGLGYTEMACVDEARMQSEFTYGQALSAVTTWELLDTTLLLSSEGASLRYELFVPEHQSLVGTVSHFDTRYEGSGADGAAVNSADMDGVTVVFEESRASVVKTSPNGCEGWVDGDYADGIVTAAPEGQSDLNSTVGCDVVGTEMTGIADATRYEIVENRLTFFAGEDPTVGFSAR
ncbi:MAG: META domain-containing protein [Acidimicrobiales bacterium]|nr:META domain-containing protein [Acidimicrobiales bacterium]